MCPLLSIRTIDSVRLLLDNNYTYRAWWGNLQQGFLEVRVLIVLLNSKRMVVLVCDYDSGVLLCLNTQIEPIILSYGNDSIDNLQCFPWVIAWFIDKRQFTLFLTRIWFLNLFSKRLQTLIKFIRSDRESVPSGNIW